MGDRGNICIRERGKSVYLYTHWGGSNLIYAAHKALSKRWRWGDPAYLARIVFDEMTVGRHGSETGYGISTQICDNEWPIIIFDTDKQEVRFEEDDRPYHTGHKILNLNMTFEEFVSADVDDLKVQWKDGWKS